VDPSLVPFKSGERKKIEQSGYFIIANIGDQQAISKAALPECRFKLPTHSTSYLEPTHFTHYSL